jgi:hypothetical protein
MALMSDFALLGEELYVAGASITKDPVQLGSIEAEDWSKMLVLVLLVVAAAAALIGLMPSFTSLMKW